MNLRKGIILFVLIFSLGLSALSQDKINGMKRISVDEFTGTKEFALWGDIASSGCDLIAYWGPNLEKPILHVQFGYRGNSWLFFNKIYFKYTYKGKPIIREISFSPDDKTSQTSNHSYGVCYEYINIPATEELLDIILEMTESTDVILRLEGDSKYKNIKYYSYWLPPYRKAIEGFRSISQ